MSVLLSGLFGHDCCCGPPNSGRRIAPACVRNLFCDLKRLSLLMTCWLVVVLGVMFEIGVFDNKTFVAWGPRETLSFLHVPINTPYKYSILLAMIMIHTFISDFISDGLVPHVINQLQDVRCRRLPHQHIIYYIVTSVWSLYSAVSQLFLIFLALGQLDLLLARLLSDLLANLVTTSLYLENKVYDPREALLDHVDDVFDEVINKHDDDGTSSSSSQPPPLPPPRRANGASARDRAEGVALIVPNQAPAI